MRKRPQTLDAYLAECRESGCTERQVQVMSLHLGGWTQVRIAVELEITQQAVSTLLARARAHLHADGETLIEHLVHQDFEEITYGYGVGDDEDSVSHWRRRTMQHTSSNKHAIKPTRRRKRPTGSGDLSARPPHIDTQAGGVV